MKKNLYRIDLNWYEETYTFYKYATQTRNALSLAIISLATKVNRTRNSIVNYIVSSGKDRYLITKEKHR